LQGLKHNLVQFFAVRLKSGPATKHWSAESRTVAYISNAESKEIFAFEMDAESGTLSLMERVPATWHGPGFPPRGCRWPLAPTAGFAANGFLNLIGRWSTETTPRGFAIDPRGRFLLAVGLDSKPAERACDRCGGMRLTLRGQYAVGGMPNWVEIPDLP
jgi:6-phosphogluconolactonase